MSTTAIVTAAAPSSTATGTWSRCVAAVCHSAAALGKGTAASARVRGTSARTKRMPGRARNERASVTSTVATWSAGMREMTCSPCSAEGVRYPTDIALSA